MTTLLNESGAIAPLIPDAEQIRKRLYCVRTEARLLARLLRVAEDRAKSLPNSSVRETTQP
jgi:hypothetical protein